MGTHYMDEWVLLPSVLQDEVQQWQCHDYIIMCPNDNGNHKTEIGVASNNMFEPVFFRWREKQVLQKEQHHKKLLEQCLAAAEVNLDLAVQLQQQQEQMWVFN